MSAASAKSQEPSMEEILASIRRIIAEDQDTTKDETPSAGAVETEDEADGVLELEPEATGPVPPFDPEPLPDIEVVVPEIVFAIVPEEPEPVAIVPSVRPSIPEPPPAVTMPEPALSKAGLTETLLSSAAGNSVGQAFNMLSHTVLNRDARTLEDLVKEMLKPMLKVWLDDNLPPLVERLVRAEIERVARGRT